MARLGIFHGGYYREFNRSGPSIFTGIGLLAGLGSDGSLHLASDCYPFVGVCSGSINTFGQEYDGIQIGCSYFTTGYFLDDVVVGQVVYAKRGYLSGVGLHRVGILLGLENGVAEVVC